MKVIIVIIVYQLNYKKEKVTKLHKGKLNPKVHSKLGI